MHPELTDDQQADAVVSGLRRSDKCTCQLIGGAPVICQECWGEWFESNGLRDGSRPTCKLRGAR